MTETQSNGTELVDEFHQLGENMVSTLRIAWNSPHYQEFQQQVAAGLAELAETLDEEARRFTESATGQRMAAEAQYMESPGETSSPLQHELLTALRAANAELQQLVDRWAAGPTEATGKELPTPAARQKTHEHMEVHPDDVNAPPEDTGHREVHPDDVDSGNTTVDLGS